MCVCAGNHQFQMGLHSRETGLFYPTDDALFSIVSLHWACKHRSICFLRCFSLSFSRCRGRHPFSSTLVCFNAGLNSNHDRFWMMNKLALECYQNACLGYKHCKLQLLRGEQLLWQTHRGKKVHETWCLWPWHCCHHGRLWLLCVLMVAVSLCSNEHYWEVLMLNVTCNQLVLWAEHFVKLYRERES